MDFNPKDDTPTSFSLWTVGDGKVVNLTFDPKEWTWKRIGVIKLGHFYEYNMKRGYRYIIDHIKQQAPFDKML